MDRPVPNPSFAILALTLVLMLPTLGSAAPDQPNPTQKPPLAKVRDDGWSGSLPGLEPDPNRTFNLDAAKPGSRTFSGTKGASTSTFSQTKSFWGSKTFSPKEFSTSEFLPPQSPSASKSFPTESAKVASKSYGPASSNFSPKSFNSSGSAPNADKAFNIPTSPDAARSAATEEADRMKLKFSPGGAPPGGVTTGRRLTVEEVKEILNRSK